MQAKKVSESTAEQSRLMHPDCLNGRGRLYGGRLLEWIDMVAGIVARRHCGCNVTTARIDSVDFLAPAFANDIVTVRGKVTYTGRTSLEVKVETIRETLSGEKMLINTAYVVVVALTDDGKPTPVPPLILETEEEAEEFERGKERAAERKRSR